MSNAELLNEATDAGKLTSDMVNTFTVVDGRI